MYIVLKMNKYYAGIGSRTIPDEISKAMTSLAERLNEDGYILRSGNATGSDQAFARGVKDDKAQIWLPWGSFQIEFRREYPNHNYRNIEDNDEEAWDSIDRFHPSPKSLSIVARQFMARNYRQIVGKKQSNSRFVICWTHDGTDVGGTGQAIRIAKSLNIPVFNLYHLSEDEVLKEIEKYELIS